MKLSEQSIKEFTRIWAEDHPGEVIDPLVIKAAASGVLRAVELIYAESDD